MEKYDDLFTIMANDVDQFFSDQCMKHKIDPMSFSAVMFARMARIANELGYTDEFIKLLEDLTEKCKGYNIGDVDTSVVH